MRLRFKLPTTAPSLSHRTEKFQSAGFTLVEMLVATLILALIMLLVLSITDQTSKIWKSSTLQIEAFQNARSAYDTMTMRLSQATLNTYLDYYNSALKSRTAFIAATPSGTFTPASYARSSDLHFIADQATTLVPLNTATTPAQTAACHPGHAVFFQAPLGFTVASASYGGLPNTLNACGYYLEFNTDLPYLPPFLSSSTVIHQRYRYRLMEFLQPTENNTIYSTTSGTGWFNNFLPPHTPQASTPVRILAENIVALAIVPELSAQTNAGQTKLVSSSYTYDTRAGTIANTTYHNQLPPLLRVVMVAIDEASAIHLNPAGSNTPPVLISGLGTFQTTPSADANTDINANLNVLTTALSAHKVNYRVFDTYVAIRGAKWSSQ
jgi:uncharacterized protein (TIGR02599 family)